MGPIDKDIETQTHANDVRAPMCCRFIISIDGYMPSCATGTMPYLYLRVEDLCVKGDLTGADVSSFYHLNRWMNAFMPLRYRIYINFTS